MSGPRRMFPTWIALVVIVIASVAGFHAITQGFIAVTSDQARQRMLAKAPRDLPAIRLIDSHGQVTDLRRLVSQRPYTVVSLVYTQCTSLCLLTASSESYLQDKLQGGRMDGRVGLVTISFDPARDTPEALFQYARRIKAEPGRWTIATVAEPSDLDRLLNTFGVVVLPDGAGDYIHNGALFLVDRRGRLFDALDPDAADVALARLTTLAEAR